MPIKKKSKAEMKAPKEIMRGVITKDEIGNDIIKRLYVEPFADGIRSMSCELLHDKYTNWKQSKTSAN